MPATHLISVDLPAPLSPTSAITSPARTSKSTAVSACTEPKLLERSRISSSGAVVDVVVAVTGILGSGEKRAGGRPRKAGDPRFDGLYLRRLDAVLRIRAVADILPLEEAAREELPEVHLVDVLRCDEDRLLRAAALRGDDARVLDRLAVDESNGRVRGDDRQLADVLEHRRRLPTGDDVLHALRGRVLAAQRDRLELVSLERDHDRVGEVVVRRRDAVDLVARLDEHLLEHRLRRRPVPVLDELLRALGQRLVLEQRIEDDVIAALEEVGVGVDLAAPEC